MLPAESQPELANALNRNRIDTQTRNALFRWLVGSPDNAENAEALKDKFDGVSKRKAAEIEQQACSLATEKKVRAAVGETCASDEYKVPALPSRIAFFFFDCELMIFDCELILASFLLISEHFWKE